MSKTYRRHFLRFLKEIIKQKYHLSEVTEEFDQSNSEVGRLSDFKTFLILFLFLFGVNAQVFVDWEMGSGATDLSTHLVLVTRIAAEVPSNKYFHP